TLFRSCSQGCPEMNPHRSNLTGVGYQAAGGLPPTDPAPRARTRPATRPLGAYRHPAPDRGRRRELASRRSLLLSATSRELDVREPPPVQQTHRERAARLLVDLRRAVGRDRRAADVAPAVRLEGRPQRQPQALDFQATAVHEARRLDHRRLDDRRLVGLVAQPLRHRNVLELAPHRPTGSGGAPGNEHHDEEREEYALNAHGGSVARCVLGIQEIWSAPLGYSSLINLAKSASTAWPTSATCSAVRSSSRISTTIARPRLLFRPTCIEAMLTFCRPSVDPIRPTMPGRSS